MITHTRSFLKVLTLFLSETSSNRFLTLERLFFKFGKEIDEVYL